MGFVSKEAARVAERRRVRPPFALLVHETSTRRRWRYATVVAYGESGYMLGDEPPPR